MGRKIRNPEGIKMDEHEWIKRAKTGLNNEKAKRRTKEEKRGNERIHGIRNIEE